MSVEKSYICVGPFAWGRAKSIEQAKRRCADNISVEVDKPKSQYCVVYEVFSDDVRIHSDGSLNWPSGDDAPVIVWMGKKFAAMNPKLSVGQIA